MATTRATPAGPPAKGLLGNMPEYNADPLAFMTRAAREYGDFVPLRLGPIRAVLLSNPTDIESVLVEHNRRFHKSRGLHRLSTLLGKGIFISEDDYWLQHRRLMQPAFSKSSVERYEGTMIRRTQSALKRWAGRDEIDVVLEARRLTLEIAAESLFSNDISESEAIEIREAVEVAGTQLQTRVSSFKMFIPDWVPTPGNVRMNAAIRRLDEIVYGIVEQRRKQPTDTNDLLALLLAASDGGDGAWTDRELRDEVVTLLLAGHETTALTLAWALFEVARHPASDQALADEVMRILGPTRPPAHSDMPNLPVTFNIINETLRLYPPAYLTARECIADVEIGGHVIKKGTLVLLSQWEQQREPTVFEDANEFRPERWSGGFQKGLERGDYFPFGMGPRMCIGGTFANLELMLLIPMIRQRFRLEPNSTDQPRPVPIVTLNPDRPIHLRLRPVN